MNARIEFEGVHKVHSGEVHALRDINLTVGKNEFLCVVGPSGCGKTTLLNLAAGFEVPTQGSVKASGEDIRGPDSRRAVVFQDHALFPWLTVRRNIEYGLKRTGIKRTSRREIVRRYIELVDLRGFENKYPHELSGGMKQRLGIARALANDPEVLLMDEPFGALDALTRERLQDELVEIWVQHPKTVIFVTHSIEEAVKLADRIVVMSPRPGQIVDETRLESSRPRDLEMDEVMAATHRLRDFFGIGQVKDQAAAGKEPLVAAELERDVDNAQTNRTSFQLTRFQQRRRV